MPAFSVGEIAPNRGPGRRDIGHGALAERALVPLIPPKEKFPYTIMVVSEVLSSNGSSSMGSACGSSLALMDAGVLITGAVAGIAMGLVTDETNQGRAPVVLTDIAGMEDDGCDMDFKVAGTRTGVTALQVDIKIHGLPRVIVSEALRGAREARLQILQVMDAVIREPRADLSPYAPRIVTMQISPEKIADLIGPKGKNINRIIEETGVQIDVEDSGLVFITAKAAAALEKAREWVKDLTREVHVGERFSGRVTRIMKFGAFVEVFPGTEGLVHISELARERVNRVEDVVHVGQVIPVVVTEIDSQGRVNLSHRRAETR
jgi:polyribonucleotide nucleotidyltransferase